MTSKNTSVAGFEKSSFALCGVVATALAAFAQSASAQDECTTAVTLTLNTPTAFSTTNATPSAGLPVDTFCLGQNLLWTATAPDVWFKWTAPSDGVATFTTCNSDTLAIDTSIALYVGSCTNLIQVGCNGDLMHNNPGGCNSTDSKLANFAVTAGTTYFIRVAGIASDFGVAIGNGSITVKHSHISAWGDNQFNQCDVPAGVTNPGKIVIGDTHGLAIKSDGTIVGWGLNTFGQTTIPTGLTSPRDIAAGQNFSVAARSNGTLAAWGSGTSNRTAVPATVTDANKVAAGAFHGLALRNTGAVVAWGAGATNTGTSQNFGQSIVPTAANTGITAIAAGGWHSLALRSTGAVIAWGAGSTNTGTLPNFGQSIVPSGALADVTKIAAGYYHSIALRSDGTVVCWGAGTTDSGALPHYGQSIVPNGLTGVIDIATGSYHTVALRSNGTVAAWGLSTDYQTNIPTAMGSANMIAAGGKVSIARYSPCAGGVPTTYYRDVDGDGFGDAAVTQTSCSTAPTGFVSNALDCNDTLVTYVDADGDTYGAGAPAACGVASSSDCNDADAAVNPAASEICDAGNTDENCNGVADNLDALALDAGKTSFYVDADSDTYTLSTTARFCDQPATGYRTVVSAALDCNDANAAVNPGASEICDALNTDENCNGSADNLDATALDASKFNFYRDQDNDTYTVANATRFCDLVATYRNAVSAAIDCNDTNAAINPGRSEICDAANVDENCNSIADNADAGALDAGKTDFFADADNDTYTVSPASRFCDLPTGYRVAVSSPIDCNDADVAINPAATEICDASDVDENCNSVADNADSGALESSKSNFYADGDSDTYTVTAASRFCDLPTGFRASASAQADCNDAVAAINPGASEICDANETDENCNNVADNADAGALESSKADFFADSDADGYTVADATKFCDIMTGYAAAASASIDCNDAVAEINPGATELCDAADVDENCNNVADNADAGALESSKTGFFADADADGFTVATATNFCDIMAGYAAAASASIDCNDQSALVHPGAVELCATTTVDNNCDSVIDDVDAAAADKVDFFQDTDLDGFTVAVTSKFCSGTVNSGWLETASAQADCNDADALINPAAAEICDAGDIDENCNNVADNADAGALETTKTDFFADIDADGFTVATATRFCEITSGYLATASAQADCNDADALINPAATEICDPLDVDENCNNVADNADAGALESTKRDFYADLDNDNFAVAVPTLFCDRPDGYRSSASNKADCNDADPAINPGAKEICDVADVDEDCNNVADDADASVRDEGRTDFFADIDADSFTVATATRFCDISAGYVVAVSAQIDCNDADALINPAATELCDAADVDEDCNTVSDNLDAGALESTKTDFFADADADGYTVAAATRFCDIVTGYVATASALVDCDDAITAINPGATEVCDVGDVDENCVNGADNADAGALESTKTDFFADADADSYTVATATRFCDIVTGYVAIASALADCNDADATVYPGAVENCANLGIDNNCDTVSASDEEAVDSIAYMLDDDQDGFGAGPAQKSCSPVPGRVTNALDCNDGDAAINPNGVETCADMGVDNNCNGIATLDAEAIDCGSFCADNDGDGFGAGPVQRACVNPVGHVPNGADCDDTLFLYADTDGDGHGAGAPAACGVASNDDGCATNADLLAPVTYFADADNDNVGDAASTTSVCETSAPAGFVAVAGDNCVNNAALQNPVTYFADVDGDGSGDAASAQQFCETTAPVGFSANSNDLCVSNADLLAPVTYYRDIDQDGAGDAADTSSVCETTAPVGFVAVAGDNCVNNAQLVNPVTYFADVDNDGAGDAASTQQFCETTAPVGFSANSNDLCVSNASLVAPVTYYADVDGDGAGDAASSQQLCETSAPAGFSVNSNDLCVSNALLLAPVTYFLDTDHDGFGAAGSTASVCETTAPAGYSTDGTDCDDNALLYADVDGDLHGAGAPVACGVASNDDNCATNVDLLNPVTYYRDIDADGAGDAAATTSVCETSAPAGFVSAAGDNCVSNADLLNPVTYFADVDNDGAGDAASTQQFCETTAPVGFVAVAGDNCVNNAALQNPVTYFADVDNDGAGDAASTTSACETSAPAGFVAVAGDNCVSNAALVNPVTYFADVDNDGFGAAGSTTSVCETSAPAGYITDSSDCDDAALLYADTDGDGHGAGAAVACGVASNDDNCATNIDLLNPVTYFADIDADGAGDAADTTSVCQTSAPAGYVTVAGDNCVSNADLVNPVTYYRDVDNDGAGDAADTTSVCETTAPVGFVAVAGDNCVSNAALQNPVTYYADVDGDGFGAALSTTSVCETSAPAGFVTDSSDCDDAALLYADTDGDGHGAGAPIACGVASNDDNCATNIDLLSPVTYFRDIDQDGAGDAADTTSVCETSAPAGFVAVAGDNCVSNAALQNPVTYYADVDGDGFGAALSTTSVCETSAPAGYITDSSDCDDAALLYADTDGDGHGAGAAVACGVASNDDLCASNADLLAPATYFRDVDNDGAGDAADTTSVCETSAPAGFVAVAGDNCVSNAALQNPVTYYADVDRDGFGNIASTTSVCETTAPAGYTTDSTDCNDADATVHPGAVENCANLGIDNNCDTVSASDEEAVDSIAYMLDNDQDGFGAGPAQKSCSPLPGRVANSLDCNDGDAAINPNGVETCADMGVDNNCNGIATLDAEAIDCGSFCADNDGDGFGAGPVQRACVNPVGHVPNGADCDDTLFLYADTDGDGHGAGAPAACGVASNDDGCATNADLLAPVTYFADADNDNVGDAASTTSVCETSAPAGFVAVAGDNCVNNAALQNPVTYFADVDGDGSGDAASAQQFCETTAPVGFSANSNDLCVSNADLLAPVTYYRDIDQDGAGDAADTSSVCETTAPVGFVAVAGDNCVNNAQLVNPVTYFADVDNDGFGAAGSTTSVCETSAPAGHVTNSADCDDSALLYADTDGDGHGAGAPAACGVASNDDNCVNNAALLNPVTYFADVDNDNVGDAASTTSVCETSAPAGFVAVAGDNCVNNAALQNPVTYFADVDGDGSGDAASTQQFCETTAPVGFSANSNDLCVSNADLLAPVTYYRDIDQDGAGDAADTSSVCETTAPVGYVAVAGDNCVNNAQLVNPVTYFADVDNDGFGAAGSTTSVCETSAPAGHVTNSADCDDSALLYADTDGDGHGAGAPAACGVASNDDNCVNNADLLNPVTYFADVDNDNVGDAASTTSVCETSAPAGFVAVAGDNCVNNAALQNPVTYFADVDNDGFGAALSTTSVCETSAPAGFVTDSTDCDDAALLYADTDGDGHGAGAPVACGVTTNDDLCASNVDLLAPVTYYRDVDNDNAGDAAVTTSVCETTAPVGYVAVAGDNCVNNAALVNPVTYFADVDNDGFGAALSTTSVCETSAPVGYVTDSSDCNDAALLYADTDGDGHGAGAPVACGVASNDDNCATNAALLAPVTYYRDADNDGAGDAADTTSVCETSAPAGYTTSSTDRCPTNAQLVTPNVFFVDADHDGYGDFFGLTEICAVSAPAGYVTNDFDCDDTALLYDDADGDGHGAGAPTACGVTSNDDGCPFNAALLTATMYYADTDGDGAGDAAASLAVCESTAPAGYVLNANDGCPSNGALLAANTFYADIDRDGFGWASSPTQFCEVSAPIGFSSDSTDCNDRSLLYADTDGDGHGTGAPAACGVTSNDDACPDNAQLVSTLTYFADADQDGAGDPLSTIASCEMTAPTGYVDIPGDQCPANGQLTSPRIYAVDLDQDGFGSPTSTTAVCDLTAPAGYVANLSDCDDTVILYADTDNDGHGAGAPAACGVTSNDDGCPVNAALLAPITYYTDVDGDGAGNGTAPQQICETSAPVGFSTTTNDQCDSNAALLAPVTYYADVDGDGFGNLASTTSVCETSAPAGFVTDSTDCNDAALLYADTDGDGHGAGAAVACGVASNDDNCATNAALLNPVTYFADVDHDGFGNLASTTSVCETSAPAGFVTDSTDCDDAALLYADTDGDGHGAGAPVACGVTTNDDLCASNVDLLAPVTYYRDIDQDGAGDAAVTTSVCETAAPVGYVAVAGDNCVNNAALVNPVTYFADADHDGFGAAGSTTSVCETSAPVGYVTDSSDCNDAALLYADTDGDGHGAGAPIACGVASNDDLCATNAALVNPVTYYADVDNDGAGDAASTTSVCDTSAPAGYVAVAGDNCVTNAALVNPVTYYRDADNDGFGALASTTSVCETSAPAGYVVDSTDCDDAALLYADTDGDGHGAGAPIACGVTSNDDACPTNAQLVAQATYYRDADSDGFGNLASTTLVCETSAPIGYVINSSDCDDAATTYADTDGDGHGAGRAVPCGVTSNDDACPTNAALLNPVTYFADVDNDGFGAALSTISVCETTAPAGHVTDSTDCNDAALLYADTDGDGHGAGAPVACGVTSNDDACPTNAQLVAQATYYRDADSDGFGAAASSVSICEVTAPAGYVADSTDCNDNALLYADTDGDGHGAGAPVACGVASNDDNCATNAALLNPVTYYRDVDADGAGDATDTTRVCETTAPVGFVTVAGDNCVTNPDLVNPVTFYRDADNDGFGDVSLVISVCQTTAPAGHVSNSADCDDAALLYADTDGDGHGAGAPVACGVTTNDDGCPTNAQLLAPATYYRDADNDGAGDANDTTSACALPVGFVTVAGDSCPANGALLAPITYYADVDGDGAGDSASSQQFCETTAPAGFSATAGDGCPSDPAKTSPGTCGCGVADTDTDSDGTADCNDGCPNDAAKTSPGTCGCGVADTDTDSDGRADCVDNCPSIANADQLDCNANGTGDVCEIAAGTAQDCNSNGRIDTCDLASGASTDLDGSGKPDECEFVVGGSGYSSIQAAINAAPNGTIIKVAPGTWAPITVSNRAVTVQAIGSREATFIDGGSSGRAVEISGRDAARFTLRGFTIRNGRGAEGAGMLITDADPLVENCVFTANVATGLGGAVRAINSAADFALVVFNGNAAASGGAVASSGTAPANGAIHFSSCQFRQNTAATDGGAIVNSAHLFLLECTLESNTAGSLGGGIRQLETGDTTIFTSRFCMNTPENISGAYTAVGENILSGDCNGNGLCDADEIASGTLADCNTNGIPDSCDISGGTPDCNSNGVPDSCDIAGGTSTDVDSNGIPDECKPDCNNNDIPDAYEIATGATPDCNTNGIPDSCDIAANASLDCNRNGQLDSCELADGTVRDCNSNGVIDSCEIATGAADADNDGRLDRCEIARGDLNLDGVVNSIDIAIVLTYWGPTTTGQGDTNFDGVIDSRDIAVVLSGWGVVPNF